MAIFDSQLKEKQASNSNHTIPSWPEGIGTFDMISLSTVATRGTLERKKG
jgi:hypothetical protein